MARAYFAGAAAMTPYEYYLNYRRLNVRLAEGMMVFGIDVHEYRNAKGFWSPGGSTLSADYRVDNAMKNAWPELQAKIIKHGRSAGPFRYFVPLGMQAPVPVDDSLPGAPPSVGWEIVDLLELSPVFYGKGKPSQIRQALRLVEMFELVADNVSAMNTYCTNYIGLDCSGFVGNFLQEMGHSSFGPQTPATAFAPVGSRRKSLDDIDALDVMCWKNTDHVAIIDRIVTTTTAISDNRMLSTGRRQFDMDDQGGGYRTGSIATPFSRRTTEVQCMVAESSAAQLVPGDSHTDGLNYTQYTIKSVNGDVFKVQRGLGGTNLWDVYISKLLS
jgi:hypothetical protein